MTAAGQAPAARLRDGWVINVAETPENDLRAHRIALTYNYVADHLDKLIHSEAHRASGATTHAHGVQRQLVPLRDVGDAHGHPEHRQRPGTATTQRGVPQLVRRSLTPRSSSARASQGQRVGRALGVGGTVDLRRRDHDAAGLL